AGRRCYSPRRPGLDALRPGPGVERARPAERAQERRAARARRLRQASGERVAAHARNPPGRLRAGEATVENAPERIEIGPGTLLAVRRILLERRVPRRENRGERPRLAAERVARRAEVDEDRRAVGAHEDVVG